MDGIVTEETRTEERPIAGSLFSGVGGVDLGAERAGFRTAWTAEIDPQARAVLRRHFPDAEHLEDVRHVGSERRGIHLLSGGFPCQDLSVAGRREGLSGARSGLWFEFHQIIAKTAPTYVLIENVPGLLSSNGGQDFAVLLEGLAGWRPAVPDDGWAVAGWIGACEPGLYGAVWRVLDTQGFGVPQRRRRVFIVARAGMRPPVEVLLERACLPGDPDQGQASRSTAAGQADGGAGGGSEGGVTLGFDWQSNWDADSEETSPPLSTTRTQAVLRPGEDGAEEPAGFYEGSGTRDPVFREGRIPTLKAGGHVAVAPGLERDESVTVEGRDQSPTLLKSGERATGTTQDAAVVVDMGAGKGGAGVTDDGSPTLSTAGPHAVLPEERDDVDHAAEVSGALHTWLDNPIGDGNDERTVVQSARPRRLTPVECERLQSFPDGWTEWGVDENGERADMADTPRYRMMGNAVSVAVAEWICRRILAVSRGEDPDESVAGLPERYFEDVSDVARDEERERER